MHFLFESGCSDIRFKTIHAYWHSASRLIHTRLKRYTPIVVYMVLFLFFFSGGPRAPRAENVEAIPYTLKNIYLLGEIRA